jgi:putative flippase GtrA
MSFDATSAVLPAGAGSSTHRIARFIVDALGYGAASAVALAVDYGALVALVKFFGVQYLVASTLAFSAGLVVAYALSTAFVFKGRAKFGAGGEFLGFLITGLCGLALNQMLLFALVDGLNLPVEYAKAPTAGCVFTFNFLTRRFLLFRPANA